MNANKQTLLSYLKNQKLMSLATYTDKSWICTVYYAVDDAFNLYFITEPTTKHATDISSNNIIACSITDSHQKVTDKKEGAQIEGICSQLSDEEKIKEALTLWNQANPGFEQIINWESIQHGKIKGRVYLLKPTSIKYFNESIYGPEGFEFFNF